MTKTIFCDIDGTLVHHNNKGIHGQFENTKLLDNTIDAINNWDKSGYKIILTTGRKESMREITSQLLSLLKIPYDQLIMGLHNGDRILINDKKNNSTRNTAYAINLVRNTGINKEYIDSISSDQVTINNIENKFVEKPWGSETLIEYNDKYVVKKLFMKKNHKCSIQYHNLKKETVYVLSGKLKLYIGKDINNLEERIMTVNDTITINPLTIHRMEAIEDSVYLETSTNELWDVVRLKDEYGRN